MKKLFIDTLGCQMNKSDTERIIGMLSHFGYEQTNDEYEADLFIVNTCAIRQLSVDKAYSRLGYWGKIKRNNKETIYTTKYTCFSNTFTIHFH